ncbi:hypothetical protein COOONC_00476 [Cooperia oncophora]
MLQTASGKILQRPLNRLIPLEIHASTKLSEGSTNEPSTTEGANTVRRKPSNRYGPEDGVALRQQPPRAAKKNVSYSETKRGSTSQAVSSAVLTTATCIFTLFGSASAATISCSNKGATLNTTLSTAAELSINYKQCTMIPAGANITEIALPFNAIFACITPITESSQYTHTLSANSTVRSRSSYQTDCREVLESTITENRPQACFLSTKQEPNSWKHGNGCTTSVEESDAAAFFQCLAAYFPAPAQSRRTIRSQVFHCPTWKESALVKFTYTGARGIAVSDTIPINTQATHVMEEANITLEFVTTPAIPLLGIMFMGTVNVSHSEAAVIEKEDFIALRCPTIDSALTSPNVTSRTDVRASHQRLKRNDDHGRVFGAVHSAVVDLTISTSALFHADSIIDDEDCDTYPIIIARMLQLFQGAEVTFSCHSDRPIMVEIECQDNIFAAACDPSTARTKRIIHATAPKYKDRCQVKCGQRTHIIRYQAY